MIVPGSDSPLLLAKSGYNLQRSLRFRSSASAYLSRTQGTPTDSKKFTFSCWVKRGLLSGYQELFGAGTSASSSNFCGLYFDTSTNSLGWNETPSGGVQITSNVTNAVFRDPSSWYHVVLTVDTTQATASNRVIIYVNGVSQTLTNTGAYTQNSNTFLNTSGNLLSIGSVRFSGAYTNYLDGYLTEVNFIDGQALTPSSFGQTNTTTGVWQPKKYTGTYGTNGFYLPFTGSGTASYAGSFNGSNQWLSGALTSAIGTGDFTVEGWVYQNTLTNYQNWVSIERGAGGFNVGTDASGNMTFYSSGAAQITASGVIKAGVWQHFAFVRSGSTVTAYLNGVSKGTATITTNFSATNFYLGALNSIPQEVLNASMSNVRITGTAVYTSNFTPPTQALTAVTGTKLLTLQNSTIVDNSGNSITITNNGSVTTTVANPFLGTNIASDQSGNGNNWTPTNISLTSGATYDSMTDVPTLTSATAANYCVLNPLGGVVTGGPTLTDGNLNYGQGAASWNSCGSTIQPNSGKWYFEISGPVTGSNYSAAGFRAVGNISSGEYAGSTAGSYGGVQTSSSLVAYSGGVSGSSISGTFSISTPIQVAVDFDNGKIWFGSLNGTWIGGGNPASGTSPTYTFTAGTQLIPYVSAYANNSYANFGQRPFTYTPPTGYVALNTFNLPTPTIGATSSTLANKYMDVSLFTGTGATQSVTNSGFQPDLVWTKTRGQVANHNLNDSVRGGNSLLFSNLTNAENTSATWIQSFDSNGFTATTNLITSGYTYVGWQWNAGGSTVTNTNGSITSQVRANPNSGFSIVTYTGTGANATVGHGLGVAPDFIILKCRGVATNWFVGGSNIVAAGNGTWSSAMEGLNTTSAISTTATALFNSTAPTSSVFSLGTEPNANGSGRTFVAYCWSQIAGFSKFGKYTGNGSADGPFVYCGFRPKYVMIKRTDTAGSSWAIVDSARDPYNLAGLGLDANTSAAEFTPQSSGYPIDFLSNGFKIRAADGARNANGGTYIFMAFAENPYKYSLAR